MRKKGTQASSRIERSQGGLREGEPRRDKEDSPSRTRLPQLLVAAKDEDPARERGDLAKNGGPRQGASRNELWTKKSGSAVRENAKEEGGGALASPC